MTLEDLQKEIDAIKLRNQRVERDKAWETSDTRRAFIVVMTYAVMVIFFMFAKLPDPFLNAIVPSAAYILSHLSITHVKNWWLKKH